MTRLFYNVWLNFACKFSRNRPLYVVVLHLLYACSLLAFTNASLMPRCFLQSLVVGWSALAFATNNRNANRHDQQSERKPTCFQTPSGKKKNCKHAKGWTNQFSKFELHALLLFWVTSAALLIVSHSKSIPSMALQLDVSGDGIATWRVRWWRCPWRCLHTL